MLEPIGHRAAWDKYHSPPSTPEQPHKWAEAIKAWADGQLVQWRYDIDESKIEEPYKLQDHWNAWRNCDYPSLGEPNWFGTNMVFRIANPKPQPKMWTRLEVEMDLWPKVRNGVASDIALYETMCILSAANVLVDDAKPAAPDNTPISPDPPEPALGPSTPEVGGRHALVRFCPACGSLGPAPFIACCPDHSEAAMVPLQIAELAQRESYRIAVERESDKK